VAQINQDRYETLAARVLGVKGAGIFGHAEDAIFAGLALDTNAPVEFWYTQRIYRFGAGRSIGAAVGAHGGIELRNTTDDQLWVVETVRASSNATSEWFLWVGEDTTADYFATVLLAGNLDTRIPGGSSQDVGSSGTAGFTPPGFSNIDGARCVADTMCTFHPGVTLAPGGSFILNNSQNNTFCLYGLTFHTRQAMPSELT